MSVLLQNSLNQKLTTPLLTPKVFQISLRGSLPPPSTTPPPSPGYSTSRYRVYTSFCSREAAPHLSISNWIQQYDPSSNTWTCVTSVPGLLENHVLKGFAMASIDDSIYIIGGRLCGKERAQNYYESNEIVEKNVEVLSTVLCYNILTDQWPECAPLGVPRYDFACAVCDNKIYVAGGQSTLASSRGISAAEVYDPLADQWTPLPHVNGLRYKCVGVTWQGKFHAVGGFVDTYTIDRCSAEVCDVRRGRWDLVAWMSQLDVPPNQIVAVDGNLFNSGDCLNAWKGHNEAYDGRLNIWNIVEGSQLKIFPSPVFTPYGAHGGEYSNPVQRLYLTVGPIGTELYFLAVDKVQGESLRTISMVHSFDTSATASAWRSFKPMQEEGERELCSHCCLVQLSQFSRVF